MEQETNRTPGKERTLPAGIKNIVFLGLVSFFADISSEMVYPIIPIYLTAVFGATPTLVGVIEGIAESAASLLKVRFAVLAAQAVQLSACEVHRQCERHLCQHHTRGVAVGCCP